MEVETIRAVHEFKAIRDEIDGWRVLVVLREASLASLAAVRTLQIFVPLVFHGGPPYDPGSIEVLNSLPVCSLLDVKFGIWVPLFWFYRGVALGSWSRRSTIRSRCPADASSSPSRTPPTTS